MTRPLRVLQVHTSYRQAGGEDAVVAAERALLQSAGLEVEKETTSNPQGAAAATAALLRAPWNRRAARDVIAAARAAGSDVAHVHNTWYAHSPAVVRRLHDTGVPVVMTLHNYRLVCSNSLLFRDGAPCEDCVGSHPWHGVAHACYRDSRLQSVPAAATIALHRRLGTWTDHVDRFIAMTPFLKSRMVASGLPPERIDVRPHFTADPGPRPAAPSTSDRVVYVGRLSPEKGVSTLLTGFLQARTDLELVIVGDGPQRAALEARAVGARVRFLGHLNPREVRQQLLEARALVFPSEWYETFGLSLIEAMAAATPVVATALGGREDLVGDAAGLLCPPGEATAWAQIFEALGDDAVDRMGAAGRARWEQRFSPSRALDGLRATYAAAVAQRHGG